ncbi:hypothetical protein PHYBLDRAFT_143037 [Phycomyces blakesleeanus NRRL 1555(-)]|uniref:Tc1-like transposase DDE domain-containing protein n=1 Tax=Phycomyces blakesleeanus (strain ATCC 8743b / DSM 1359 / FGSC 10004 / NBRC 33097 / NRRL 1555) TaxID=763407 RepID=A0A162UGF7_PHYB8|nr:hypothetical protein PHYBLDRAFT_143037 [Phycomyces blakesleeanus NRRL 1555(-)]OAD76052.1 hypothetical protein PHYBLDRAFT_143037 [Phycomyces blakesleeanus NRRL 1555(-)]|eukprot:XP_018294092.1 hypothetical protein PHYBLDRAFT_143037 [Phycomyces blakesleeanus NRRL 1555(-)]
MRELGNVKKKRAVGTRKRKTLKDYAAAIPKRTTADNFVQLIKDSLDIMDEFPNMKGLHMAMYNALVHSHDVVDPFILERGYIPVHLPPYSPELNPINFFWKDLNDRIRREKLKDTGTLSRIIGGNEDFPVEHIHTFI